MQKKYVKVGLKQIRSDFMKSRTYMFENEIIHMSSNELKRIKKHFKDIGAYGFVARQLFLIILGQKKDNKGLYKFGSDL